MRSFVVKTPDLLSAMAYVLIEFIRSSSLGATELANAQCATIRLKLFKIGALIVRKSRRTLIHLRKSYYARTLRSDLLEIASDIDHVFAATPSTDMIGSQY